MEGFGEEVGGLTVVWVVTREVCFDSAGLGRLDGSGFIPSSDLWRSCFKP